MTDQNAYEVLVTLATTFAGGYLLVLLARKLGRSRPGFRPVTIVLVAFALRILSAAAVSLTGISRTLRGGDELLFLDSARQLATEPLSSGAWASAITSNLHEAVFAIQFNLLGDVPDLSLRVVQALFGVTALLLLAGAVYDLGGQRAGRIALVALTVEPTSVFFSTLLHKEALMLLAAGLVVFGGTLVWRRARLEAVALMVLGSSIGIGTRPYAGYFLAAGGLLVVLHGSLRSTRHRPVSSALLLALSVAFVIVVAPTAADQTSDKQLQSKLQGSQDANVNDASNLKLEKVDYSTRGAVARSLPRRIRDVTLKPYPWQLGNASQGFGLIGTMAFLAALAVLASELVRRRRGSALAVSGPFVYVGALVLVGYALSTGNAGTGFRYRTHVVQLAICAAVVLRWRSPMRGPLETRPPASLPVLMPRSYAASGAPAR